MSKSYIEDHHQTGEFVRIVYHAALNADDNATRGAQKVYLFTHI